MKASTTKKAKARLTANIIKHIFEDEEISKKGGEVKLSTGSKSLSVTLGVKHSSKGEAPRLGVKSMMRLQTACNLSDKTVL